MAYHAHHEQGWTVKKNLPGGTIDYIITFAKAGGKSYRTMWHFIEHTQVSTLMRGKAHKPKVWSKACSGNDIE